MTFNDIQHNNKLNSTFSIMVECSYAVSIMLSVVILNVSMIRYVSKSTFSGKLQNCWQLNNSTTTEARTKNSTTLESL
jgi:hypothetical protein